MVLEGAIEAARGALVRRGAEKIGEAVFEQVSTRMVGADIPATFSVGATAFIAATSAVVGGLAGWALHDLLKGNRK